jgi:hypothetical protein
MKKVILFLTYFLVCFFSFSQNKVITDSNTQVKAFEIISKVLSTLDNNNEEKQGLLGQIQRKIEGGHRTGNYKGSSDLNFMLYSNKNSNSYGRIKLKVYSSIYDNGFLKRQETEFTDLTNFKFINSGGSYGTKIITADWDGYEAKFTMELTDDKDKDDVYFSIKGKSNWEDYARINISETLFQELVNILSVTKIPQNVLKQKEIKLAKEKIRKEIEENRIKNSPENNEDYLKIIGKPIKIGNLEVAEYDFPKGVSNSETALELRKGFGKGWRVPTKSELNILYKNKNKIGGFDDWFYRSSTGDGNDVVLWFQDFTNGKQKSDYSHNIYYSLKVRLVRTL